MNNTMRPEFKTTKEGLVIVDPIERERYPIKTGTPVKPTYVREDPIPYPMDTTISVTTGEVTLAENNIIYVRYQDGSLCTEIHSGEDITLPKDKYVIDISVPIKVYLYVESNIDISIGVSRSTIRFGTPSKITISARSFHQRPAETITTTAEPIDIMKAVSMFGSALKSTSSERSYPTHRGHPPAFELGDELSIPPTVDRPKTGIIIEVPPTLRHVFTIVSLAYYLGAKIVPGPVPRLRTETGYSQSLIGDIGFEAIVGRVLKQFFFFDCIVQTEGESPSSLHARRAIEPILDFDIEDLYGQSIVEKVETYLEVPFETVESELPGWYSEVHLPTTVDHVKFLPFIANDLAIVKPIQQSDGITCSEQRYQRFKDQIPTDKGVTATPATDSGKGEVRQFGSIIQQRWMNSDGRDIVSTKPLTAFQNSISQSPREDPLRIEVVCNDTNMNDEFVTVHSTYNDDSHVPLKVNIHHELTTEELQDVFAKESDFLHYIGHIDSNGFQCSNGTIGSDSLESVKTKAFFLNACRSYEQGLELIEAGSIGGIVTLTQIQNRAAVAAGSTIARLLNSGIPLYAALTILQKITTDGFHYHPIGDCSFSVSNFEAGPPISIQIAEDGSGYEVTVISYANSKCKPGAIFTPYISSADSYYLVPNKITFDDVSKPDLVEFLNMDEVPVLLEGELRWSNEIKTTEL